MPKNGGWSLGQNILNLPLKNMFVLKKQQPIGCELWVNDANFANTDIGQISAISANIDNACQ